MRAEPRAEAAASRACAAVADRSPMLSQELSLEHRPRHVADLGEAAEGPRGAGDELGGSARRGQSDPGAQAGARALRAVYAACVRAPLLPVAAARR